MSDNNPAAQQYMIGMMDIVGSGKSSNSSSITIIIMSMIMIMIIYCFEDLHENKPSGGHSKTNIGRYRMVPHPAAFLHSF